MKTTVRDRQFSLLRLTIAVLLPLTAVSALAQDGPPVLGAPPSAPMEEMRLLQNPSRRPPTAVATRGSVSESCASAHILVRPDVRGAEKGRFRAHSVRPGIRNRPFRCPRVHEGATRAS